MIGVGVGIGIGIERSLFAVDREKLDRKRAEIDNPDAFPVRIETKPTKRWRPWFALLHQPGDYEPHRIDTDSDTDPEGWPTLETSSAIASLSLFPHPHTSEALYFASSFSIFSATSDQRVISLSRRVLSLAYSSRALLDLSASR